MKITLKIEVCTHLLKVGIKIIFHYQDCKAIFKIKIVHLILSKMLMLRLFYLLWKAHWIKTRLANYKKKEEKLMIRFLQIKIFKKKELESLLLKIIPVKRCMAYQLNNIKYLQKGLRFLLTIQVIWEMEIKAINREKLFIIIFTKMEINLIKQYPTIWEIHFLWAINKKYRSQYL
jgi:hypothetical protein